MHDSLNNKNNTAQIKISKESKEFVQCCLQDFVTFVTSEGFYNIAASLRC
jgi:hypothetical protein